MSENNSLLSILIVAKNDNYTPNYIERLSYTLNFLSQNIKELNLIGKIRIEIVDWGSKILLSKSLKIIDEDFNKIIHFYEIDENISKKYDELSLGNFFVEVACNVGFRRSSSDFVLNCPADQLLSKSAIKNLYYFLLDEKKKKKKKFYILQRKILDNFFYYDNFFEIKSLNTFLENHNFLNFEVQSNRIYYGGGVGGLLISKEDINKINGYDENNLFRGRYGGADNLTVKKLMKTLKYEELLSKGVCMFKLPYSIQGKRSEQLNLNKEIFSMKMDFQFKKNFDKKKFQEKKAKINFNESKLDSEDWGIGKIDIPLEKKNIEINKDYLDFNRNNFFKKSNSFNNFTFLRLFSVWFIQNDNFTNFLVLINILNCLKKFNVINFFEIGSNKLNRILSISKLFPFLKIIVCLEKSHTFGDNWFYISSKICNTHKGYFKGITYDKEIDIINENLRLELDKQKFSNFLSIENFTNNLNFNKTLDYIYENRDLFGLILVKKDLKDLFHKSFKMHFLTLSSFGPYFLLINSDLNNEELKKNFLENRITKSKIVYYYLGVYVLRSLNFCLEIMFLIKKKLRKWK